MNEIAKPASMSLASSTQDQSTLRALSRTNKGPAILSLGQPMSKAVQQTEIKDGQFFIENSNKEFCVPLSKVEKDPVTGKASCKIKVLFVAWRPKAVQLRNESVELESYDFESPTFNKIKGMKKDQAAGIIPMYGIECLFYIPPSEFNWDQMANSTERSLPKSEIEKLQQEYQHGIPCLFFYTNTNRDNNLAQLTDQKQAFMIGSTKVSTPKYSWWVSGDNTPIPHDNEVDAEWIEKGLEAMTDGIIEAFVDPPDPMGGAEVAEEEDDSLER